MLNENQLNFLPERIYQRLNAVNSECLESIGKVIKEIGELRPKDVHQLQQMYDYGADLHKVSLKLAEASKKNIQDIYEIFDIVAKENYDFAKPFYKAKALPHIPYSENKKLKTYVKSLAKQTVDEYINLTQHTAFAVFSPDGKTIAPLFEANKNKIPTSLSDTYTKVIDLAVSKVQTGVTDYNSAMRECIKALADSGIKTVDYATGYSRRLDTSVRQNVLWGIKECNQNTADMIGEEFEADGYEISYHSNPRPSHEEMGGRQYAIGKARTVNGVYYPSFSTVEGLLEEYNCLHFKFPILLGVSEPAYSNEQLRELKAKDKETFEFEGKQYTKYEASQMQRKIETKIRHLKDEEVIAKAAGNDDLRREVQGKINLLTDKYAKLSKTCELPTKMERMQVKGFRSVKTEKLLTNNSNSGIINYYKGNGIIVAADSDIPDDVINKVVESTREITSDFKILESYSEQVGFGNVYNGLAINIYTPSTGKNQITLDKSAFSDEVELVKKLNDDFKSHKSYKTNRIESLVAHEMGHNAHIALALKRAHLEYGKPLNVLEISIFKHEYDKILQEIYLTCFNDETFDEIQTICAEQLGNMVRWSAEELIAQSFGNYYYGETRTSIAKKIVEYFKKGLK